MEACADVSEWGKKNATVVCSGTFMIVSLSSAVIKGNPKLSHIRQSWFNEFNIGSLPSAEVAFEKLNFIPT